MKSALSSKVAGNELVVLDKLALSEIKTKEVVKVLGALQTGKKRSSFCRRRTTRFTAARATSQA